MKKNDEEIEQKEIEESDSGNKKLTRLKDKLKMLKRINIKIEFIIQTWFLELM